MPDTTTENKPVTGKPAAAPASPLNDNKTMIIASSVGALAGLGYAF